MTLSGPFGALLLLGGCLPLVAQESAAPASPVSQNKNEVWEGVKSSFSFPIRSLFTEEGGWRATLKREMSVSFSMDNPLLPARSAAGGSGLGSQGDRGASSRSVSMTIKDNPVSYWFAQITFVKFLQPELQRPWNPDFTYSFGYDDWHPFTFSLIYSNFNGNRIFPDPKKKEFITNFAGGSLAAAWKFKLPARLEAPFLLHKTSTLAWNIGYSGTPRYLDLANHGTRTWKQAVTLSCRNSVYKWLYWNVTAYYRPHPQQQQPWDPDFTYGFGYFDYRPGKVSVEYNNYAGNRYPWRRQGPQAGKFRSGGISIMWTPN